MLELKYKTNLYYSIIVSAIQTEKSMVNILINENLV